MKTTIDKAPECLSTNDKAMWVTGWNEAVDALKEAIAQPEQEPAATKTEKGITLHVGWDDLPSGTKLYTSPPRPDLTDADRKTYQAGHNAGVAHHKQATKRKWVGLTDDEIALYDLSKSICVITLVASILKEKNT